MKTKKCPANLPLKEQLKEELWLYAYLLGEMLTIAAVLLVPILAITARQYPKVWWMLLGDAVAIVVLLWVRRKLK